MQRTFRGDPFQVSHWKRQFLEGASERFTRGKKTKDNDERQAQGGGAVPAALVPVNCANWSITTTKRSVPAANVCCWACLDPRCTTGPRRCSNRRYGSCSRSMLSTLTISSLAAAEWWAAKDETPISRDRVRYIMCRKGLRVIYQKPRTSIPGNQCERFPCLVDLKLVTAVEQVWATAITDIPLQRGFLYLMAVVDLLSRNILSWKLSNSLDTEFCLDTLEMPLSAGRKPEIFFRIRVDSSLYPSSLAGRRRLKSSVFPPEYNDARPQNRPVNGTHLTACRPQNAISGSRRLYGQSRAAFLKGTPENAGSEWVNQQAPSGNRSGSILRSAMPERFFEMPS